MAWRPGGGSTGVTPAVSRSRNTASAPTGTASTVSPSTSATPLSATESASTGSRRPSSRLRALRTRAGSTRTHWSRSRTTGRWASARVSISASVSGSPPRANCQRNWSSSSLSKNPVPSVADPGAGRTTAAALRSWARSRGQWTATPAAPSRLAATPSRSDNSSSERASTSGTSCSDSRSMGGQTRAARRTARAASTRARGPNVASASPAHSAAASTTRVGSARLCTWTTAAPARRAPSPSSKSWYADRSRRSEIRTPASMPAATSAAQSWAPGSRCGPIAAKGLPEVYCAAGVRGSVSATASRKDRISASGSGSRSGPLPGRGTACPSYGRAAATALRWAMSSGSSGPARQASKPSAVSPGSSRPRATSRSACSAAAPQQAVAGCAAGSRRAPASSGRASPIGRVTAGTVPLRIPGPCRRTTVSSVGSPDDPRSTCSPGVPRPELSPDNGPRSPARPSDGSGSLSGSQKATRPSRGSGAGRKTAASRIGTALSATSTPSPIRPLTSRPSAESVVFDSTGGV